MRRESALIFVAVVVLAGCGSAGTADDPFFGAPRVTDAQAAKVSHGMAESRAFRILGGKSPNANVAPSPSAPASIQEAYRRNPVDCFDYPVSGTERPPTDNGVIGHADQWEFCFKHRRLVSKRRTRDYGS